MSFPDGGVNEGLVEDLYDRFRNDPTSVPERWRRYFDPARGNGAEPGPAPVVDSPDGRATPPPPAATAPPVPTGPSAAVAAEPVAVEPVAAAEEAEVLRGAAARTV